MRLGSIYPFIGRSACSGCCMVWPQCSNCVSLREACFQAVWQITSEGIWHTTAKKFDFLRPSLAHVVTAVSGSPKSFGEGREQGQGRAMGAKETWENWGLGLGHSRVSEGPWGLTN